MAMSEATLRDALQPNILAKLKEEFPEPYEDPKFASKAEAQHSKLATAIAKAVAKEVIDHITGFAVVTVAAGIPVSTPAGPGATSAPGSGTIA